MGSGKSRKSCNQVCAQSVNYHVLAPPQPPPCNPCGPSPCGGGLPGGFPGGLPGGLPLGVGAPPAYGGCGY